MPKGSCFKKAWLIFWEWYGENNKISEDKVVVAVLNPRLSGEKVKFLVQQIYTSLTASHSEKISVMNDPDFNPFRANFGHFHNIPFQGIIRAGHNPWLCAKQVQNLRVINLGKGKEKIEWDEIEHPNLEKIWKMLSEGK